MERFAGSEVRRFLAQQDDAMGRQSAASGSGVPAQRSGEPPRISEEDVHRARLAVARGARDAEDCRLLLEMLGLAPGEQGEAPVRE